MGRILLIETATETCSVALAVDGETAKCLELTEGYRHSEMLTVLTGRLLHDCGIEPRQLDAVCVSRGPGSYTGLRIGVSVAKGLCYSLDIPLIAVSSLDAMALHCASTIVNKECSGTNEILICPMLDARRMEVYTALYDHSGKRITPVSAKIITGDSFRAELENNLLFFCGNGAAKCRNTLTSLNARFQDNLKASARFMSYLAEECFKSKKFENVAYFEPYYLKDFIATVPKNKVL